MKQKDAREIARRSKEITEGYTELLVYVYPSKIETRIVNKGNWLTLEEWDKPTATYRISKPITIKEVKEIPF